MKRIVLTLFAIFCMGGLFVAPAQGINDDPIGYIWENPHVDGLFYLLSGDGSGYAVIGYDENAIPNFDGHLVIPSTVVIDNQVYPVSELWPIHNLPLTHWSINIPLLSVTIPESIIRVGYNTFTEDEPIDKIIWDAPNCEEVYFNNGIRSIEIGPHVTKIPDGFCINETNLTSVIMGENVDSLGSAFNYTSITSIEIPQSVTYINQYAFYFCDSLKTVTWDAPNCKPHLWEHNATNIEEFIYGEHMDSVPSYGCSNLPKLRSVTLGNNIKSIGEHAFQNCDSLTAITFPAGLDSIGAYAFIGCQSLTSIEIPSLMTTVAEGTFWYSGLQSIVIPDNITRIENTAFADCNLSYVSIGQNVTYIDQGEHGGYGAFDYNPIKKIVWDAPNCAMSRFGSVGENPTLVEFVFGEHITVVPEYFSTTIAVRLQLVTFGENVTTIRDHAFESCYDLDSVYLPDPIDSIGAYAFSNCPNLKSIEIPSGLTTLSEGMFSNSGLQSVVIPDNITSIGYAAFSGCSDLSFVIIGSNVQTIDGYAFSYCNNLDTVRIKRFSPPQFGDYNVFPDGTATLIVPCGAASAYSASEWANYFETIVEDEPFVVELTSAQPEMGSVALLSINCAQQTAQISATPVDGFEFVRWSDGSEEASRSILLTQDTALTATFKVMTYSIRFVDWDGQVLKVTEEAYHSLPSAPENPERVPTAQYTYTFVGWSPEVALVTGDATYTALYDSIVNSYTITFLNEDNTVWYTGIWAYGEMPICESPTKEETEEFAYRFDGWNPEVQTVTGAATYQATFLPVRKYTLVFLDWNGDMIEVIQALEGSPSNTPVDPIREGYDFVGWSRDLTAITSNMYVIALYKPIQQAANVIYKNQYDQVLSSEYIELALPAIQESGFVGWFVDAGDITDGIVIRTRFEGESTSTQMPEDNNQGPKTAKILRDNHVYIIRGDKVYTILGKEL